MRHADLSTRQILAMLTLLGPVLTGCSGGGGAIDGRMILTLDDADIPASAYADGMLAPTPEVASDTLTALRLPLPGEVEENSDARVSYAQLQAANSMTSPSSCLSVSPDQRLAVVASGRMLSAKASPGQPLSTLTPDTRLTVVDLGSGGDDFSLHALQTLQVGAEPVSVAFDSTGAHAVVLSRGPSELTFFDVTPAGLESPRVVPIGDIIGEGAGASSIAWRPNSPLLAVTLADKNEAALLEVQFGADGSARVLPWGEPVKTGPRPGFGMWSRNGRFFITADQAWSDRRGDVRILTASGSLTVIQVADTVDISGDVKSATPQIVRMPSSPDAVAMNPDGDLIAIASLRPTDLVAEFSADPHGGELILLSFDDRTGAAEVLSRTRASALPTALAFDAAGKRLLVADYRNNEVQVWRVVGDKSLEYTELNVGTGPGPHAVVVVGK